MIEFNKKREFILYNAIKFIKKIIKKSLKNHNLLKICMLSGDYMFLTTKEEKILNGECGIVKSEAMSLLVRMGDFMDAEKLIPVKSAHVSGVSYNTLRDGGTELLEKWASEKTNILTTLNPCGMDLTGPLQVPSDFRVKQKRIINGYMQMGILPTFTCTPYLCGNLPRFGEDVAWSESSAVSFINTMGARTIEHAGLSALASAILGLTPLASYHLDENRKPTIRVVVENEGKNKAIDPVDFALLGYCIGGKGSGDKVALIEGVHADNDDLKSLCAAVAVHNISLVHVRGVTPDAHKYGNSGADEKIETIQIDEAELNDTREKFGRVDDPDLIFIGCPHSSLRELEKIASMLRDRKGRTTKTRLIICTARQTKKAIEGTWIEKNIKSVGGEIVCDTCMVVCPLKSMDIKSVVTNSAKAAYYLPLMSGVDTEFRKLEDLIDMI